MVPLREDLLIMLGASGLTDLIASGTLQLEADLIMAARCKTHCEEDDRNDEATMNKEQERQGRREARVVCGVWRCGELRDNKRQ